MRPGIYKKDYNPTSRDEKLLFEMKTIMNKRISTTDSGEEKIGELEEIIMEVIKNEVQLEKKIII